MVNIDVMEWIRSQMRVEMVKPEDALPGREIPILDPMPEHLLLGLPLDEVPDGAEVIHLAMGCYWGAEKLFWQLPGVLNTAVGFMGGYTPNPTYQETCTGSTGHTETVKVVFDPARVSRAEVLRRFWENHDPTTGFRQGNDVGTQYRSAIFATSQEQLDAALASKAAFQEALTRAGMGEITTEITAEAGPFYFAEEIHQQYLEKNPDGYCPVHATGVTCG